jgi:hypothetical protein
VKSRHPRWYLVPLVLLAAAMAAVIVVRILPSEPDAQPQRDAVPEKIRIAGPPAEAAYRFLVSEDLAAEPLDALIVDFLGRRFGIAELRRFGAGAVSNLLAEGGYRRLYVRLVMPASDLPAQVLETPMPSLDSVGPVAYYPLRALSCDRVRLEDGFLEALAKEAGAGGYRATHSALALIWGYEQGCIDKASTADLYEMHLRKISEVLTADIYPGDLYAESLAMVEFMSESPAPSEFVDKLVGSQTASGAIMPAEGETSGSTHTTALALWAFLERTDPPRSPGDWIVMPGPPAGPPLRGR